MKFKNFISRMQRRVNINIFVKEASGYKWVLEFPIEGAGKIVKDPLNSEYVELKELFDHEVTSWWLPEDRQNTVIVFLEQ